MEISKKGLEELENNLKTSPRAILFEGISQEKIEDTVKLVKEFKNLSAYVIKGENKSIVIRYKKDQPKNISTLADIAYNHFKKGEYEKASIDFENLISLYIGPNPDIFQKAGLSYYNLGNYDKAYNYLKIAKLSLEAKNLDTSEIDIILDSIGFTKTSASLVYPDEVIEPIININFLRKLVFSYDEIELNEFIEENLITKEELVAIKLIIAEYYYKIHYESKADKIIKSVERDKFKNAEIKKFLEEIKKNKKLYLNRVEKDINVLKVKGI